MHNVGIESASNRRLLERQDGNFSDGKRVENPDKTVLWWRRPVSKFGRRSNDERTYFCAHAGGLAGDDSVVHIDRGRRLVGSQASLLGSVRSLAELRSRFR